MVLEGDVGVFDLLEDLAFLVANSLIGIVGPTSGEMKRAVERTPRSPA